jgi:hypothetical protein
MPSGHDAEVLSYVMLRTDLESLLIIIYSIFITSNLLAYNLYIQYLYSQPAAHSFESRYGQGYYLRPTINNVT